MRNYSFNYNSNDYIIVVLSYHVGNLLTWRTLAEKPSVLVDTLCSGSTGVAQTLIEVHTLEWKRNYYNYYYFNPIELV